MASHDNTPPQGNQGDAGEQPTDTPTPATKRTARRATARPSATDAGATPRTATTRRAGATPRTGTARPAATRPAAAAAADDAAPATDVVEVAVEVADPMAQIDEVLGAAMQRATVTDPQLRMLARALRDCGLGVSADDVRLDEATRRVTITLEWKAVQQLTSDLQDIADERPVIIVTPPVGPTLFDPMAPAGPVAPQPAGSGLHIEVPA